MLVASRVGIPALLRRPEPRAGRFVAVASAAATRGLPMLAAYCAAKAGVTGLVRALAAELRGTGVTANAVSPGSTATPILDESARLYGLESAEAFSSQQPIARLIRPEEVAAAIVWLAGAATDAVTGATIPVDGGLSLYGRDRTLGRGGALARRAMRGAAPRAPAGHRRPAQPAAVHVLEHVPGVGARGEDAVEPVGGDLHVAADPEAAHRVRDARDAGDRPQRRLGDRRVVAPPRRVELVDRVGRPVERAQRVGDVGRGDAELGLHGGGQLLGRGRLDDRRPEVLELDELLGHARGLDPGDAHQVDVDPLAADALVEQHVVAPVRLLAAALGVVLVDAADRLVGEAQPELVDDQAEVAEVQRAGEELEAVVPRLALDVGQGVAVERVHAVADRRAQRSRLRSAIPSLERLLRTTMSSGHGLT